MLNKTTYDCILLKNVRIYRYFNPYLYATGVSDKDINDNNVND